MKDEIMKMVNELNNTQLDMLFLFIEELKKKDAEMKSTRLVFKLKYLKVFF